MAELACGSLKDRATLLALWRNLPQLTVTTDAEALFFLERNRLWGRGIGYIDLHLLACVLLNAGTQLWTRDKRLRKVAVLPPVLEALESKCTADGEGDPRERAVANYAIAELLRAGAVEIGYRDSELLPQSADVEAFRQLLGRVARGILRDAQRVPWFLSQQAALFQTSVLQPVADLPHLDALERYKLLHDALLFRDLAEGNAAKLVFAGLIAQQLGASPSRFAVWADEILDGLPVAERRRLIDVLGHARPDLLQTVWKAHKDKRRGWTRNMPGYLRPSNLAPGRWNKLAELGSDPVPLIKVIRR